MKVGLVGEAPTDTKSIEVLLSKKYQNITFVELLKNITGSGLENPKNKKMLRLECQTHKPDFIIFIRDLDGLMTKEYRDKRLQRQKYYKEFIGCTQRKKSCIFLLNIWEIEALILSDMDAFNKYYGCNIVFNGNPMLINEPKEYLQCRNNKYSETDNRYIFEYSDFHKIYSNCDYFKRFIDKFDILLKNNTP